MRGLPKTLEETYDRILLRIDEEQYDEALKLLQWLAFSSRPMTLVEMAEIFAIDTSEMTPKFDPDQRPRDSRDILDICSSLVSISYKLPPDIQHARYRVRGRASVYLSGTMSLAHFSVKEYLISEHIRHSPLSRYHLEKQLANTSIARECLAYLLHFDTAQCLARCTDASRSFGKYAAEFWHVHARSEDGSIQNTVYPLITRLFQPQSLQFDNWMKLFDIDVSSALGRPQGITRHPLYYASRLGLGHTVSQLLPGCTSTEINAPGLLGSALGSASYAGHAAIVRTLLDHGADVNVVGKDYGPKLAAILGEYYITALANASAQGHEVVVRLLLDSAVDVDAVGGYYGTSLEGASARGHEVIARLLLDGGANVNAVGGCYGTALTTACAQGRKAVVQLLLERGAETNVVHEEYGDALTSASWHGHVAIVQLLLESGADVNVVGGRLGSALSSASFHGHEAVVQLLLESGADVKLVGGHHGSALAAASITGHVAIMELLLEGGAFVNLTAGENGSALASASWCGRKAAVQLLLKNGADVNLVAGFHGCALIYASFQGHEEIVRLLIQSGADVNLKAGRDGKTALTYAAGHYPTTYGQSSVQYENIVRLLLENGADVTLKSEHGLTALVHAIVNDHRNIIEILLENGADVEEFCDFFGVVPQTQSGPIYDRVWIPFSSIDPGYDL